MTGPLTTRSAMALCPNCGEGVDAYTSINPGKKPRPGDCTVCMYCAAPMMIGDDLRLRLPTSCEIVMLAHDPVIKRAIEFVQRSRIDRALFSIPPSRRRPGSA